MKKILLIFSIDLFMLNSIDAQNIGIGTNAPNPRAILELNSTNKGFLLPRVLLTSGTDNTTIPNAPFGLMVINENEASAEGQGIYIQVSGPGTPTWRKLGYEKSGWQTTGNFNSIGAKLGHNDNIPLQFIVNNQHVGRLGGNRNILFGLNSGNGLPQTENLSAYNNIVIGNEAFLVATVGTSNIVLGNSAMGSATGGSTGIAIGGSALANQADGALDNIAIGFSSMVANTTGGSNIGIGRQALWANTTGRDNIGIGFGALEMNKANNRSLAVGLYALQNADDRTTGIQTYNTAVGHYAMRGISPASGNTARFSVAVGDSALARLGSGEANVAIGFQALSSSPAGRRNIAIGRRAGRGNGNMNGTVAIGDAALQSNIAHYNIAIGDSALSGAGSFGYAENNIGIGRKALQVASQTSNAIAIGHEAMAFTINASSIAIGNGALKNQRFGGRNTALGNGALFYLESTENNIAIGDSALARIGQSLTSGFEGSSNIGIGYKTLYKNQSGRDNTVIGTEAMRNNTSGLENTVIGAFAMANNNTGNNNTMIGLAAGINNLTGSGNVFIGNAAGADESGSNRLYISNSNANRLDALIHGDFATPEVWINGRLKLKSGATNGIELGYNLSKETNAGRIGYAITTPGTLDIYGAGTNTNNRAIKFWAEGGSNFTGSVTIDGFTRMGSLADAAPRVKMKKMNITGPSVNAFFSYATGIPDAKILGVNILMNYSSTWKMPPNYTDTPGYEFNYQVQNGNVVIINKTGNSGNIGNKPITILITYEE